MNSPEIDVSLIIVNWNTANLTIQCLASIATSPPSSSYEILLVDNASTDDSLVRIRQAHPEVHLIENEKNVGFGVANNQAIAQSRGRYLHLVNSDTIVHPGAVQNLIDFMDTHPQAGACGSYYLNPDGTLQTSCYPFPTLKRELWRLFHLDALKPYGVYDMADWDDHSPRQVEVLQGASLFLRRSALEQTGAFDPDYFMYTEEVDMCYRLVRAGWKLFWEPASKITHFGGQSTRQAAETMFINLYASKILFFSKHYGKASAQAYKTILALGALSRLALAPFVRLICPTRKTQQVNIVRNYRSLLKALPTL